MQGFTPAWVMHCAKAFLILRAGGVHSLTFVKFSVRLVDRFVDFISSLRAKWNTNSDIVMTDLKAPNLKKRSILFCKKTEKTFDNIENL